MTGPGVPHELRLPAGPSTTARRPATGSGCAAGSPDDPTEWAFATHKPCPVDGCPGPAQLPMWSPAHQSALDHGDPDQHTVLCKRCGAGPDVPAQV
ncbi:hypothetical protein J2Z21_007174 [Streptomyces griseochromogenes]|uniref:Uncharacterized protein n=1 Tax=Streptomyces griseochromogenes TaxID=68214 RepID=A0ABS4M3C0_9ACTN|nr:hypothetical protein [Streptomyces griseochromogenes]MBP2054171.1 hypothetical protein [Streptomyces griseochromogenes]